MAACGSRMLVSTRNRSYSYLSKNWTILCGSQACRRWQTTDSQARIEENLTEYSETPEYPPCFDTSPEGLARIRRQKKYDRVLNASTVEEKYINIITDAHISKCVRHVMTFIDSVALFKHYNTLPLSKYATRTHFVKGLPSYYTEGTNPHLEDAIVKHITPSVLEAIRTVFFHYEYYRKRNHGSTPICHVKNMEKVKSELLIDHIHKAISATLHQDLNYLDECQVDYRPRVDSFWLAGGFPVTPSQKRFRKKARFVAPLDEPMNYMFQLEAHPYMQIRNEDPLPQFVHTNDDVCVADDENRSYGAKPGSTGFSHRYRHPSSVPGVWQKSPCGFGTLSYHTREEAIVFAKKYGLDSMTNAIDSYAIFASFGWLNALAYNKGFTSFQDVTYPLSTQTVVTNGQLWSLYAYQLNTVSFNSDFINSNVRNVCWATNELKLFESVTGDLVNGFNPDVLRLLVRFYLNAPKQRVGVNLTPYLKEKEFTDEEWTLVYKLYRDKNANKPPNPRHIGKTWFEKIYKIWFNTRIDKLK